LAAAAALGPASPRAGLIGRYQVEWRHIRPSLNGDALLAMGYSRGPLIGRVLDELLTGRLDGSLKSEADERALAQARQTEASERA
ncbi:MAG: hypothetical protein ACRDHL_00515, partial [Candidatus Promineifilaceae bacterium]